MLEVCWSFTVWSIDDKSMTFTLGDENGIICEMSELISTVFFGCCPENYTCMYSCHRQLQSKTAISYLDGKTMNSKVKKISEEIHLLPSFLNWNHRKIINPSFLDIQVLRKIIVIIIFFLLTPFIQALLEENKRVCTIYSWAIINKSSLFSRESKILYIRI